jgi:hypothetical protein
MAVSAVVMVTSSPLALPSPASARHLSVLDDRGDTVTRGLDITDAAFSNRNNALHIDLVFAHDRPGDIIAAVKVKGGSLIRVVGRHHPDHDPYRAFLVDTDGARVPCRNLNAGSSGNEFEARFWVRIPSRCLDGGDYGAVRHWVRTERFRSGADVDHAPEKPSGAITFTRVIPRG